MADKKTRKPAATETPREGDDKTYRAALKIGDKELATITIRATDDEDAKKQLALARENSWAANLGSEGEWELTKTETTKVA